MATIDIQWVASERMSIREIASNCGFNLAAAGLNGWEDYKELVISEVTKSFLKILDEKWHDKHPRRPLSGISKGVYIISFSDDIYVNYKKNHSQVVYIGKGKIRGRIQSHLKNWIAYISESLQDMRISVSFAEIKVKKADKAFEEVESDLLDLFWEKYGEYPLLNKIAGKNHHKNHKYINSSLTFLRAQNSKKGWGIRPMPKNEWAKSLD